MTASLGETVAIELSNTYDKVFNEIIKRIESEQLCSSHCHRLPISVENRSGIIVGTITFSGETIHKYIREAQGTDRLLKNSINERFLFYMDMHFSKKYRILTNSTYDSKIRKLKISITKPAKKVGEHNMVMMITLKDKNENKLGVVLANVENMSVAEIIEIQKMVELRRTEWPDVPQDEIITMVERAMLDKGIQLVEYTNYIIEY